MEKFQPLRQMNLELTTACPLRCPQCYCTLEGGKHLDLDIAKERIDEAVALGLENLNLSGGETMCYPHLYELIAYAARYISNISVALSGVMFDQDAFEKLVEAGIDAIHISLNGSTPEINALTRDGYDFAIDALSLLQRNGYKNTIVNWVMHSNNADDFLNVMDLAEQYEVAELVILSLKPDSNNAMKTYPSLQQIRQISSQIKQYKGKVKIRIESCYSNLLAYHLDTKLLGNLNYSRFKGCVAGREGISVTVDGEYTPCRHLEITESFDNMKDYWEHSQVLAKLRTIETDRREPCSGCGYSNYCRHCQAINWQIKGELYLGFEGCPVHKPTESLRT